MNYIRFNIFSTRNLMLPVAFIVFLTYHIPEIITQSTPGCFNTMMITLFSWSGPTNSYNPQGYHHPFSYTVAQSDYQEHYFSVSAYKIDIQGISFSYECNLQNVTSTGAVMYFNPSIHSYIVSIQFCVILKQPCSGEIFMKSIDYQPITNNPTNPIISQLTEIYVDKPFGNGINRYITQAYVSSFITGTTIGSYFKMNIALQPIQPGLNYQKILINMDQQILQKIKFLYLLIDLHSFIKLPLFEIYTTVVSSPPVTMSQYFAPNQFQKCILGMVYSQVKTVATSTYEIQLSLGSLSYDYLAASNNQVLSSVFCMAFCYPWQYPYPTSPSIYYNKCAACPIGCINCANLTFCITCKTSYYLLKVADYHQLCNPCLQDCLRCNDLTNCTQCFVGMTTQNGCSFGQSCSRVDRFYIYTDNRCTLCIHPSFLVSNRTCICPVKYFMVAGLCTNVIGCSSTELKANGDIICLSCKFLENFLLQPQNQKCICKENYELVGDKCVQKCGDGIRFDLQCDDGNNVNMDGCSSTCIVESGFACTKRINKADRCVYIRRDIRLLLKSVHKISLQNKAIFTFNIFPTFLNQKWVNISNQSFFRTTRKIQILQKTHQNGQLIIFLQYFEDLQDYQAQINLNINYYYALQNNYTTTIKMQDHGKLVFISNVQMLSILQFIYFSINLLIVAIFFISMFIHKMIVIQLLIPIQLLYLTFSFFGEESSVTSLISFAGMSCFDMLSSFNSFLNPYKQQNQLQNVYHSFLFTSFLQIAIFCLFIILFLIVKNFENKECKKKLMSKLQKIYNCFLFPLSIALMLIFQSYYSFWQLNKYLSFIEKCLNIILVKLVGLVYFFQWKIILTQKNSKVTKYETNDFKQKYVGAYLSFVLIFSTILQLWVIGHEQYAQIYLILLTIGFIVFTIFYRPYSKIFSNFGIVINFLPTLYVIMYIMLRKHEFIQTISEQDSLINVVIVIVLILCSIIVTIARLIIIIKQRFKIKEQIKNKDNISVQPKQKSPKVMKGISQIIKNDLNYFYACKTIQDGIKSGDNGFNYIHNQNKDHVYRNLKAILLEKAKSIAKKRSQK